MSGRCPSSSSEDALRRRRRASSNGINNVFLVYPPHVLHEPRQLGVVLRKLRAPRLGEGGIRPSAVVLDGPLQLRNDRVVGFATRV